MRSLLKASVKISDITLKWFVSWNNSDNVPDVEVKSINLTPFTRAGKKT